LKERFGVRGNERYGDVVVLREFGMEAYVVDV